MKAEQLIEAARADKSSKARSLVITFMGEIVSVQPERVWLGSIIGTLAAFGLSERLVRTTCNRLLREGWLQSCRGGRKSYYHFSEFGARQYQRAAARIYAPNKPHWDGYWTVMLTGGLKREVRATLAERLGWLGFGCLNNEVLLRAGFGEDHRGVLQELDVAVPVFRADTDAIGVEVTTLCRDLWAIGSLAKRYKAFINRFIDVAAEHLTPELALSIRVLLIHEYRRIVLTDPELPNDLLPSDWAGDTARTLASELYRSVLEPSDRWLSKHLVLQRGSWPVLNATARSRFKAATWSGQLVALA
ncbi:MAG: hypothetical protein O7C67_11315 [Gammaproteobacteria bacterium]|nr:hypothetical protein [Gammaproteobacteria bacterium]